MVSSLHGTFKNKIRPMLFLLFPFITKFYLQFVCLRQNSCILSFVITLSVSQTHMNEENKITAFIFCKSSFIISISHALIHMNSIFSLVFSLILCSPFLSVSFFFFLSHDAAGISFLSYWSQSAQRGEDIRMERESRRKDNALI